MPFLCILRNPNHALTTLLQHFLSKNTIDFCAIFDLINVTIFIGTMHIRTGWPKCNRLLYIGSPKQEAERIKLAALNGPPHSKLNIFFIRISIIHIISQIKFYAIKIVISMIRPRRINLRKEPLFPELVQLPVQLLLYDGIILFKFRLFI